MPNLFRCSRDRAWPESSAFANATGGQAASGYSRFALFHHQRDNVEIDEPILRIEDFHVVADRAAAPSQRFPIETSNAFIEPLADCFARLESK